MLQKIQDLFMRLVRIVEEHPAPLRRYFQLYFAILAVRLSLEFFSSHKLFQWADVVHIGLWFVFIVLAFLLQLTLFSGEKITKVTRLCIVGFTIALTAPIIDLILNGGVGAKMNYLSINSIADVPYAYVTLGGPSLSRGATLGIRIEIVLLVLASFNYVRTKRRSILWGLASAWSIYTVLFLSGMVPKLLGDLVNRFGLVYGPDDQSTLLLLLLLDLLLLGACLWRYAPSLLRQVLQHTPWAVVCMAASLVAVGAGLARHDQPLNWALNPTTLFWLPLLLVLGGCIALLLGLQRLQIAGQWPAAKAEKARNLLIATSLGIALAMEAHLAFVAAALWGALFLLNEPPLNLRRAPLLRNLLESMALTMCALAGYVAYGAPMVGFPVAWLLPLLLLQLAGGLFADIRPSKGHALPMYPTGLEWLAKSKRPFLGLLLVLYVAAPTLGAWLLLSHPIWIGVGAWCLFVAIGFWVGTSSILKNEEGGERKLETAIHAMTWALIPMYGSLVYVAWQ